MLKTATSRPQQYAQLALAFRPPPMDAPRELARAYTRLFLGPGKPAVHPYESVHREAVLMGEAAIAVSRHYQQAGFQCPYDLPDHISAELAFMSHLAAREESNPSQAAPLRNQQRLFLHEHILRWVPGLCETIDREGMHPAYRELARTTLALLESDRRLLDPAGEYADVDDWQGNSPRQVGSRADPGDHLRRVANMHLQIETHLCTMCALCVDNCPRSALNLESSPLQLSLVFKAARCNGCRACLRLCPEQAIRLSKEAPQLDITLRPPHEVAASPRVICPQCQQPHIAMAWLKRLSAMLGNNPAISSSLLYCPLCKTHDRDGLFASHPSRQEWSARA